MKKIILTLIFCFVASVSWATDYYIDLDWTGTEAGTFLQPYNSVTDLTPATGDDYYFRCGSSETLSAAWTITAVGTSANYITFSAYYDSNGTNAGTTPTGTAVLENDSPSMASTCGGGLAKPILKRTTTGTDSIISTDSGTISQYLEFNSLNFQDCETPIYIKSNYNAVRYSYFYNTEMGIWVGLAGDGDYNTIEYNFINLNDATDEDAVDGDGIKLSPLADHNTIQYNKITGFDHGGVNNYGGDYNTIQYNYIYNQADHEDYCINSSYQATNGIYRFNYCKDAGMGFSGISGNDHEIYGNIFTCNGAVTPSDYQGCVQLNGPAAGSTNANYKIYNNVIYDNDNFAGNQRGFAITAQTSGGGAISGIEFHNNIIQKLTDYCIRITDTYNVVSGYTFYNNSCYDYPTNEYGLIEGTTYTTATLFNGRADATGNREDDPGMNDPVNDQFWPASSASNIVGSGYDLGTSYDNLLDPDNTDFTASPPSVTLETQPANWIIGAYGETGGSQAKHLNSIILNGAKFN